MREPETCTFMREHVGNMQDVVRHFNTTACYARQGEPP
jgi:hypothetical protein